MSDLLPARQGALPPQESAGQAYVMADEYAGQTSAMPTVRLRRMLRFLLRFWWIPIITTMIGAGAGAFRVRHTPALYTSYGRMWETEKLRLPGGAAFTEDLQNYYGTQMALLESDRMLQLAIENLRASGTNNVPLDKDGQVPDVDIKARQQKSTRVIVLEATSSNARFAQAVLNSLMGVFQTYRRDIRENVSHNTLSSISRQVEKLEVDLKADQRALAEFQKTNNLTILQEEGTISGGYLARLKTQLSDLEFEAKLLNSVAGQQVGGQTNNASYVLNALNRGSSSSGSNPGFSDRPAAYHEVELLKIQREKLGRIYKAKHPKIARLDSDIERAEKLIDLHQNQTHDQLASTRESLRLRTENVLASIKEWETRVIEAKTCISEAERLQQNVSRSQALYDRLVGMLENVDLSRNIDVETMDILERATPAVRSHTRDMTTVALGAMLGLALGLGLVLLIEISDDRFNSVQEVTAKFGDSIVGLVPEITGLTFQPPDRPTAQPPDRPTSDQHLLAESYRSLRSALLYLPVQTERPRVILVTSALPGEGKSTVATNLARAMAMGGSRVLLLDADMRKGRLHHTLQLKSEPGLADLLNGGKTMDQVSQTNCLSNLTFVARGKGQQHPGDLFLTDSFNQLLSKWRQAFDYVVIDSCPVFASDDVATLAPKMDGTLFVVRHRYSRSRSVKEALELLAQRQAKILGLVFNRARPSARPYYYSKYAAEYAAVEPEDGRRKTEDGA